ncbi:hypothetical protein GCM10010094_92790 [Streptomyces flaveus]|uniref:Uncharacterized protein n=1 Tax=Streptomyces flaveus TaxID=66370 RepID=A0A917RNR3_9ACTN|nr:hypothetical protein GCM10010094_92790 [Streptomyces flaveus]
MAGVVTRDVACDSGGVEGFFGNDPLVPYCPVIALPFDQLALEAIADPVGRPFARQMAVPGQFDQYWREGVIPTVRYSSSFRLAEATLWVSPYRFAAEFPVAARRACACSRAWLMGSAKMFRPWATSAPS